MGIANIQGRRQWRPISSTGTNRTHWICLWIVLLVAPDIISNTFKEESTITASAFVLSRQYYGFMIRGVFAIDTTATDRKLNLLNIFKSRYADSSMATNTNSTIPTPSVAAARVGIKPTIEAAPAFVWKWLWRGHQAILPFLHMTDDSNQPPVSNNDLSLWVLWNKAIAAQDINSPVYDNDWTYDMLPGITRNVVKMVPNALFPRLYHANIEIRTAYLNQIIQAEMIRGAKNNHKIRIVSLGAGYDARCTRLLSLRHPNNSSRPLVEEAWELDLPDVTLPKTAMLLRLQQRRRSHNDSIRLPFVRPVDLNNSTWVSEVFRDILFSKDCNSSENDEGSLSRSSSWHTIFISEAVFIYLDKGQPGQVLQICQELVMESGRGNTASLCFADRLENSPGMLSIDFY
jgi:Leucine carboxyl methyltransferase